MPIVASASEFGVATGANVGSGAGTSAFDGPPNDTSSLIIQPDPSDPNPYLFTVGETYDITYTAPDGSTVFLDDAEVTRSDASGINVVVFHGLDADGNPVDVVWAEGFDLQGWYDANQPNPGFYTGDRSSSTNYGHVCFAAETLIATPKGLRPAGEIKPGDSVQTLDNGIATVRWVASRTVVGYGPAAPVTFAPGTIGNDSPLVLSQQHRVLHASQGADMLFAAREVLIPAAFHVNDSSVCITPVPSVTYVHILLDQHEVLFAQGAKCESLYLGDVAVRAIGNGTNAEVQRLLDQPMPDLGVSHTETARRVLRGFETRVLSQLAPLVTHTEGDAREAQYGT